MKTTRLWMIVTITAAVAACFGLESVAGEVNPGDNMEAVISALGQPKGYIKLGTLEWYYYDRGEVRLKDGAVTSVELVSAEEAKARQKERDRQAQLLKEQQEQRRAVGEALRASTLADMQFGQLPAAQRAAFWNDFRSRYPEVDVSALHAEALAEAGREAGRAAMEQRVAEMEQRVREAEERALRSEQAVEDVRRNPYYLNNGPLVYTAYVPTYRPTYTGIHRSPIVSIHSRSPQTCVRPSVVFSASFGRSHTPVVHKRPAGFGHGRHDSGRSHHRGSR